MPNPPTKSPFRVFTEDGKYIGGSGTLEGAIRIAAEVISVYPSLRVLTDKDEHIASVMRSGGSSRVRKLHTIARFVRSVLWEAPREPDPVAGLRCERRVHTEAQKQKGWDTFSRDGTYNQYFCEKCDGELTPGPSGAGTNQVCERCRINYGCLSGALVI